MSIEAYEVSYQGQANERFKNALLDDVMWPAWERTKEYAVLSEDPHILEMRTVQQYVESGPLHVYTVYASKDAPRLDIMVSTHTQPSDMTWQEAEALRLDVLDRHGLDQKFKDELRAMTASELLEFAALAYVSEARYEIDLIDRTLSVTNELSCTVYGMRFLLSGSSTELDEGRQMVFDADEVVDIVRALHGALLVDESRVREFLDVDF